MTQDHAEKKTSIVLPYTQPGMEHSGMQLYNPAGEWSHISVIAPCL